MIFLVWQRRLHQAYEQRVRILRRALVFGVELGADEEGVGGKLHDFHQTGFRVAARGFQAGFFEGVPVHGVELVAVTVAFADISLAVELGGQGTGFQLAGEGPETHGAAP